MNARLLPFTNREENEEVKTILDAFNPQLGKKLPHKVFMEVIAKNDKHAQRTDLDYRDPNTEIIMQDCEVRFFKEYYQRRISAIVFEDNTHLYLDNEYTLKNLRETIKELVLKITGDEKDAKYFEDMAQKDCSRVDYFKNKGLSKDEALCCSLVLSFYTGKNGTSTSEETNRETSQVVRFGNDSLSDASQGFLPLMYFMIKALSHIPYYWGPTMRSVELTEEELSRYITGSIIGWTQFSSSTCASEIPSYFAGRNTIFHLYSLTGRDITQFSNFQQEREVLFAPYSTFLVTKKQIIAGKTHIFMRQVELGITEHSLLWIDDRILDPNWENKAIMEKLSSEGLGKNLHIIPKPSTKLALSYLDSKFGQFLKKNSSFQIISDMNRPAEVNGNEAGAIGLKEIRARDFDHKFSVYTSNAQVAKTAIEKHVGDLAGKVFITVVQKEILHHLQGDVLKKPTAQKAQKNFLQKLFGL